MFKGVKGSEDGVKRSEMTNVQYDAIVFSLLFTPFHFFSLLLFFFLLSPFTLQGQCGVKVKGADEAAYRQALAEYEQKHYREASKALRTVAQRNPKAADPQFWLGMAAVKNGFNTTGIRKYFTKCVELCPDYPNALAHYYMGMILYTDERYEEATAELETYFRMANHCDDPAQTAVYEEASAYLHWSRFLAEAVLHMAPFDPAPLAGVSSAKRNENLPFITHDGSKCYYLREVPARKDRTSFYVSDAEKTVWKLFVSQWKDTAFNAGSELPAPFNQGDAEGGVSVTADGRTLYFSRITYDGGYANCDIYRGKWYPEGDLNTLEKKNNTVKKAASGKWEVERMGSNINGERTWESQPSVSADGQWLYFASNRKGGVGGTDIWRCHRLKNGDWSRPENLGARVNTVGSEKFPFLHADGHTLYFVSDGWQGFGGYDVYFIDLAEGGEARPTNLGLPINTENDELSFGVTADGTRAYFPGKLKSSRSREILTFDLYPAARPEPMRCCRATVTFNGGEKDTLFMLSERTATAVTFAAEGCLPAIVCVTGKEFASKQCRFALSDSTSALEVKILSGGRLSGRDERLLDAWAQWLIDHPRVHLAVECPTLAEAKAVCDYLLKKKKLRAERLVCRGGSEYDKRQMRLL